MIKFIKSELNKRDFEEKVAAGIVNENDIVFLKNEKQIWSGNTYYGGSGTGSGGGTGGDISEELEDIYKIMYNQHGSVSINSSTVLIEKGIPNEVTITWNYQFNGETTTPDYLALMSEGSVLESVAKRYDDIISNTKQYTAVCTNKGITKNALVTINAYYPIYTFGSASLTVTSDLIKSGTKVVKSSPNGSYTINLLLNNMYFWLCVPEGMSINKVTLSGFSVPMNSPISVKVSDKGTYKCYRSVNTNDGGIYTLTIN